MKNTSSSAATGKHGSKADSNNELSPAEQAYRNMVIPYLLTRAYHIPGNSWLQDWYSYMTNNHPLFGICLHHRYHPIKPCIRMVSLIGSILFGLAVTNVIYIAFVFTEREYDRTYLDIKAPNATQSLHTGRAYIDNHVDVQPALTVTSGNLVLWTVGAAFHAVYDNVVWSLAACTCCMNNRGMTEERLERFRSSGMLLVMLLVIVITALATFAVAMRSAVAGLDKEDAAADKLSSLTNEARAWRTKDYNEFEFLIAYFVELVLNFFVYYPVIGSLLFSGCLTCGRYPVLGGRPYEMKHQHDVEQPEQSSREKATRSTSPRRQPSHQQQPTTARSSSPRRQPPSQQPAARSSSPKRQTSNRQPSLRKEKKTSQR